MWLKHIALHRWLSARLHYLQYVSNGDTKSCIKPQIWCYVKPIDIESVFLWGADCQVSNAVLWSLGSLEFYKCICAQKTYEYQQVICGCVVVICLWWSYLRFKQFRTARQLIDIFLNHSEISLSISDYQTKILVSNYLLMSIYCD